VAPALGPAGGLRDVPGLRDFLRRLARLAEDRGHDRRLDPALQRLRRGRHGHHAAAHARAARRDLRAGEALLGPLGFHPSGHTITSPQGARLRFAYLEKDADAENYQGDNNTRVYIEELGNFPNPAPVMKMMATLRSHQGRAVGFRATGNPGGPGHGWVKARYIDAEPAGWKIIEEPFVNPWTGETVMKQRIFIPGRITDHNLLGPDYIASLQMSGSPEMVRAWLEGDWDIVAGAYFSEFSRGRHVLEPFDIPEGLAALHRDRLGLGAALLDRLVCDRAARDAGAHGDRSDRSRSCPARWCATASGTARTRSAQARTSGSSSRSRSGRAACSSDRGRGDRLRRGRYADVRRGRRAVAGRAREQGEAGQGQELNLRKADKQRLPAGVRCAAGCAATSPT
jgi:hypothetical protein